MIAGSSFSRVAKDLSRDKGFVITTLLGGPSALSHWGGREDSYPELRGDFINPLPRDTKQGGFAIWGSQPRCRNDARIRWGL